MRRRIWIVAGVAVVAVGAGAVVFANARSSSQSAASSAVVAQTVEVQRTTLHTSESRDGTVAFADESVLRSPGQGLLTAMAPAGSRIRRNGVLFRINQEKSVLMIGAVPAYRPLTQGDSGKDVRQLQRNLRALDYKGFSVDGDFGSGTADAVSSWQDDAGLPGTGSVPMGQVVFQPGAVRMGAASAEVGQSVQPGQALADISGVERAVTVTLDDTDRDLARVHDPVSVDLNTRTVPGRVREVTGHTTTAQDGSSTTTYDVTIDFAGKAQAAVRALPEGADVTVGFRDQTARDALVVPVKALLALAEGGVGVEVVGSDGSHRVVAVTPGLFAAGQVEITSASVSAGDTVVVAP